MTFDWLKTYMPRSLFGRSLLILLFPVVFLQLVVGLVFIQRHFAQVTGQMTNSVALELVYAAEIVENAETEYAARQALTALARPFDMKLDFTVGQKVLPATRRLFYDVSGQSIVSALKDVVKRPLEIDLVSRKFQLLVRIETANGKITAIIPRDRVSATNPHQLLVLMVLVSILLTVVSILFLRNQIRPIRLLAHASEAYGQGRIIEYEPTGAREVRRAGVAFLSMRNRIERQTEQRTQMLSGVSHDMRTPLTRLTLSLAMLDQNDETENMQKDVGELEEMLGAFLAYARGEDSEQLVRTDLQDFFDTLLADCRRGGHELQFDLQNTDRSRRTMVLRPMSLTRAMNNLLGNAFSYAKTVRLGVQISDHTLHVIIEDDGPGIPEADRREAVKPFVRLDPARGRNDKGGVGLGLSIALEITRAHGGKMTLGQSRALGGLSVTIELPR